MLQSQRRSKVVRFLLVGGLNTAFGYALFAACLALGMHYGVAVLVTLIIAIGFNFLTYGRLVFRNADPLLLPRFAAGALFQYVLNVSLVAWFKRMEVSPYLSQAILVVPLAGLSYFINNQWVFREYRSGP